MTLVSAPATVGAPDIAEPADDTLPGPWTLPLRREPTPLTQFAAPGWTIPSSAPPEVPSIQVQLRQIRDWTGWSSRTLGMLTGTTQLSKRSSKAAPGSPGYPPPPGGSRSCTV